MKLGILSVAMVLVSFSANSAVLIEEAGRPVNQNYQKAASSAHEFRRERKIGLGISTAGALGLMGVNFEINFSPTVSFNGGFGVGKGFQSFGFMLKNTLVGSWFAPYIAAGYSRWYTLGNNNASIKKSTPGFLAERFLSDAERRSGEFAENLIYPSAGIQYQQLKGQWAGASMYAQILMLIDIDDFVSAPTGELGLMFYF